MNKHIENYSVPAAHLKRSLADMTDDTSIIFSVDGVPLRFSRFIKQGDTLERMEFSECAEPEYRLANHLSVPPTGPDQAPED